MGVCCPQIRRVNGVVFEKRTKGCHIQCVKLVAIGSLFSRTPRCHQSHN